MSAQDVLVVIQIGLLAVAAGCLVRSTILLRRSSRILRRLDGHE